MNPIMRAIASLVLVIGIMLLAYAIATPGVQPLQAGGGGFLVAVYVAIADRQ